MRGQSRGSSKTLLTGSAHSTQADPLEEGEREEVKDPRKCRKDGREGGN